ncbi:MAG: D-amino acid aminotransferase [Gemmatimonadetes bacterium]|nr:D-amino acid aminotransferase [Gemmatimonadota bacterium]
MSTVYLGGDFVPKSEAVVSVDDRGFLLGDGVYEVVPFYEGVPFFMDRHLARLRRSLAEVRIDFDTSGVPDVARRLVTVNGLDRADRSIVYLQVTRGVAPRTHYFPEKPVPPTVYGFAKAWSRPADAVWNRGFTAITVPDRRWMRVDIKTINLLPNALAFQAAKDVGVDDAILVRDGVAIEGAHQNFWGVFDGTAVTHPETNLVLSGITRGVVLEVARAQGIPVEERPIQVEELAHAEELFFTGATGEVRPCVQVDGKPIGDGRVGAVTRALSDAFLALVERTKEAAAVVR